MVASGRQPRQQFRGIAQLVWLPRLSSLVITGPADCLLVVGEE
ncbi:MAG: hypothetical protein VYB74_04645 [Cyanobacteriota bacterium]|nr:hypothetical protein [Cyanobacteriota bacterium]